MNENTADTLFARALRAYDAHRHAEALPLLREALEAADDRERRIEILFRIANAHDALGHTIETLEALHDLLDADENNSRAWNNLGVVCARIGRLDEAREAFERAYRLDPSNASVLASLGSVALKMSDPGAALQYLTLAVEIDAAQPQAHANMAITLAVFGRLEAAEEALRLAALHGFTQTDPIQQRIDKLREHRDRILREAAAQVEREADEGAEPGDGDEG